MSTAETNISPVAVAVPVRAATVAAVVAGRGQGLGKAVGSANIIRRARDGNG